MEPRGGASAVHRAEDDVDEFLWFGVGDSFAAVLEGFGNVDGDVLHAFVGFLGAAHEEDVLGFGDAFVAVFVVEADADKANDLRFRRLRFLFRHGRPRELEPT